MLSAHHSPHDAALQRNELVPNALSKVVCVSADGTTFSDSVSIANVQHLPEPLGVRHELAAFCTLGARGEFASYGGEVFAQRRRTNEDHRPSKLAGYLLRTCRFRCAPLPNSWVA